MSKARGELNDEDSPSIKSVSGSAGASSSEEYPSIGPKRGILFPKVTTIREVLSQEWFGDESSAYFTLGVVYHIGTLPGTGDMFEDGDAGHSNYARIIHSMLDHFSDSDSSPLKGVVKGHLKRLDESVGNPNFRTVLINLIAAAQSRTLTVKHMSSFLASEDITDVSVVQIVKLLNSVAGYITTLSVVDGFEDIWMESKWLGYRLTKASWQSLLSKCGYDLTVMGVMTHDKYEELMMCDMKDPESIGKASDSVILAIALCLKGAGKYPENWYRGNKVIAKTPEATLRVGVGIWKEYYELFTSFEGLGGEEGAVVLKEAYGDLLPIVV